MRILITGASSGIGFATVERLMSEGHELLLLGRTQEHIERASARLRVRHPNASFSFLQADLTNASDRTTVSTHLKKNGTPVDAIIHSAGIFEMGALLSDEQSAYDQMHEINLRSIMQSNREWIQHLKQPGGRIVLIGSTAGLEPHKRANGESIGQAYSVTKWALRGYACNLREEGKARGIGVTLVSPGCVLTEMWGDPGIPANAFSKPEDVAEAIAMTLRVSSQTVIEEIVLRPLMGNI